MATSRFKNDLAPEIGASSVKHLTWTNTYNGSKATFLWAREDFSFVMAELSAGKFKVIDYSSKDDNKNELGVCMSLLDSNPEKFKTFFKYIDLILVGCISLEMIDDFSMDQWLKIHKIFNSPGMTFANKRNILTDLAIIPVEKRQALDKDLSVLQKTRNLLSHSIFEDDEYDRELVAQSFNRAFETLATNHTNYQSKTIAVFPKGVI